MRVTRLTPAGAGGVALVRVEGSGAAARLERHFVRARGGGLPSVARATLGRIEDAEGSPIDEVVLVRTGPEAFELGCHGGPGVVAEVVRVLGGPGPGGDRSDPSTALDRVQAEAWAALPAAGTELACQVLLAQIGGAWTAAVARACDLLATDPDRARTCLEQLSGTEPLGRALLVPPRVVLSGLPNAGKSSLMNALLARERVIVSDEPGTTRDVVEEVCELDGVPVRLVDTAGLRDDSPDPLEAEGVARARRHAGQAACRVVVVDGAALSPAALELARGTPEPRLVALNKLDLLAAPPRLEGLVSVPVSALRGDGIEALRARLRELLVGSPDVSGPVVFTPRQAGLVAGALRAVDRGDRERAAGCLRAIRGLE